MLSAPFRTGMMTEINGVSGIRGMTSGCGQKLEQPGGLSVEIVAVVQQIAFGTLQQAAEELELRLGGCPIGGENRLLHQEGEGFGVGERPNSAGGPRSAPKV